MIRRVLVGAAALLLLASVVSPALAQTSASGSPVISLTHEYRINDFGFGLLNETITFTNNSTSTEQIPSVQLGIPDNVSSHATGFMLTPTENYTMSSNNVDNVTVFTISPISASLAASASSTVSLKTYLTGVLNITAGTKTAWGDTLLLRPSLNQVVDTFVSSIEIPESGSFLPIPTIGSSTFNSSLGLTPPRYELTQTDLTPTIVTEVSVFNDTDRAVFLPMQVFSVYRAIVPSTSGLPQVQDRITVRNLAYYAISNLPVVVLASQIANVTILPSSATPTINPRVVTLTNEEIALTSAPFNAPIEPGDNFSFTMAYTIPKGMVTVSGTTVSVAIPYTLPIPGVVENYTVLLESLPGTSTVGNHLIHVNDATPIALGNVTVTYRINTGWAADEAVPAASLVFGAVFIILAMSGSTMTAESEEEEEEEKGGATMLSDLIKALEDKIALLEEAVGNMANKQPGAVSRAEFLKVRANLDSLRNRAFHRLSEVRQSAESKPFLDVLNQIQEAGREEDRAAKDLLNLYEQYQNRKMREDTFQRLLPNYRKRVSAATNRLSDLLNMAQKESGEE